MRVLLISTALLALGMGTAVANGPAPAIQPPGPEMPSAEPPGGAMTGPDPLGTPTAPPAAAPPPEPAPLPPAQPTVGAPGPGMRGDIAGGFSVGGFYGFVQDGNDHLVGLNLSYDLGLAPGLGLTLQQAGFWNIDDGIGGRSVAGVDVNLGGREGFIPYVGARIGAIYGEGIDNSWLAGPEIGIRLGIIDAKVGYDMPFNKSIDDGNIVATIGLGLRF